MIDDGQLIERALSGDPSAFGELVQKYQDRLYNALWHVLGSADDARDVAQDAFVQAFVKLDSFRGASKFYTWLYRIGFNLAMSHARRRPTASLDQARESFGAEPTDAQSLPEENFAQQERVELVHAALGQLNTDARQILVLRELEGCSYDQIAEILDLAPGTVRSRLFRARAQLRDQLVPMLREEIPDTT